VAKSFATSVLNRSKSSLVAHLVGFRLTQNRFVGSWIDLGEEITDLHVRPSRNAIF
jgi:hypothetical protein